jgi:hypothetical protein
MRPLMGDESFPHSKRFLTETTMKFPLRLNMDVPVVIMKILGTCEGFGTKVTYKWEFTRVETNVTLQTDSDLERARTQSTFERALVRV